MGIYGWRTIKIGIEVTVQRRTGCNIQRGVNLIIDHEIINQNKSIRNKNQYFKCDRGTDEFHCCVLSSGVIGDQPRISRSEWLSSHIGH